MSTLPPPPSRPFGARAPLSFEQVSVTGKLVIDIIFFCVGTRARASSAFDLFIFFANTFCPFLLSVFGVCVRVCRPHASHDDTHKCFLSLWVCVWIPIFYCGWMPGQVENGGCSRKNKDAHKFGLVVHTRTHSIQCVFGRCSRNEVWGQCHMQTTPLGVHTLGAKVSAAEVFFIVGANAIRQQ